MSGGLCQLLELLESYSLGYIVDVSVIHHHVFILILAISRLILEKVDTTKL